jgi:hypothetical protein
MSSYYHIYTDTYPCYFGVSCLYSRIILNPPLICIVLLSCFLQKYWKDETFWLKICFSVPQKRLLLSFIARGLGSCPTGDLDRGIMNPIFSLQPWRLSNKFPRVNQEIYPHSVSSGIDPSYLSSSPVPKEYRKILFTANLSVKF